MTSSAKRLHIRQMMKAAGAGGGTRYVWALRRGGDPPQTGDLAAEGAGARALYRAAQPGDHCAVTCYRNRSGAWHAALRVSFVVGKSTRPLVRHLLPSWTRAALGKLAHGLRSLAGVITGNVQFARTVAASIQGDRVDADRAENPAEIIRALDDATRDIDGAAGEVEAAAEHLDEIAEALALLEETAGEEAFEEEASKA